MDCSPLGSSVHGISQAQTHRYREQTSGYQWKWEGQYSGGRVGVTKYWMQDRLMIPSAQRLVWAAKQALGNATLGPMHESEK